MSTVEDEFRRRLNLIMQQFGSVADLARAIGVSDNAIYKWVSGRGQPSMTSLVNLAQAAGVSVEWLATGHGVSAKLQLEDAGSTADNGEFVAMPSGVVPAVDSRPPIKSAQIVDDLRFRAGWLKRNVGIDPQYLALINAEGDSMAPTVESDDLLLVDFRQVRFKHEGLYAIANGEALAIKRLQLDSGGNLIVRSDNPAYDPVRVAAETITLVGKVVWLCAKA